MLLYWNLKEGDRDVCWTFIRNQTISQAGELTPAYITLSCLHNILQINVR